MSEQHFDAWRSFAHQNEAVSAESVAEREVHLRAHVAELVASGLADDEAFLIAVKRMSSVDELARGFARAYGQQLWQPTFTAGDHRVKSEWVRDLGVAIALGAGAAVSLRAGMSWLDDDLLVRLAPFLVLPWLAGFFAWRRPASALTLGLLAAGYVVVGVLLASYPFASEQSDTLILAVIHAPILLWLMVGVAYAGGDWRSGQRRMEFIRFTGEWAVYYFLIAAGGGVLLALAAGTFATIDMDPEVPLFEWILPMGAAGAVVIAAWLVESKRNVVENIAPQLARVFSPLTILLLLALLVAFAVNPHVIDVERELLILMTVILVLVLGLWLYAVSARPSEAPPGLADGLQIVLVVAAIVVDLVVLVAMASRIAELGLTPNRSAALGLNILLLVNLLVSAWLGLAFVRGKKPLAALERWQTSYLPWFGAWAAVVVVLWGPIFSWA